MKTHYQIGTYKRVRNRKGRFISKVSWLMKRLMIVGVIVVVLVGMFRIGQSTTYTATNVAQAEVKDTLKEKVEVLKNEVVETIRKCESQGNKDLIYTFDPDPRQPNKQQASFGQYQYKLKTIVDYTKILKGEIITERQALDIALDENKARELTKEIVFKDTGKGVLNWYHCSNKHNLKAKVGIIKELEK